ncbi:MAG: squalene/phytoene synthase family protein [Proteobacteria bacterium]|jgi:phytoene synthase|nr:squalene/phytoene synthase family protein [Pseudomonadota bacterium]
MTPDEYCRERAAPRGSTLHYCLRLVPADRRRAVIAIQALGRELDDAARLSSDAGVARVKLAWWRGEVGTIHAGKPSHPVALALQAAPAARSLARADLEAVVDGAERDVEHRPFADFAALEAHCARTAGVVATLSAMALGRRDAAALGRVRELAVAARLVEVVRDVGSDARQNRVMIPQDDLARFGVAAADILARHTSQSFTALMATEASRVRERCDRAAAGIESGDRSALGPWLAALAIGRALLGEIERDGYRVLEHRIALTPLRKLLIATRALRGARPRCE